MKNRPFSWYGCNICLHLSRKGLLDVQGSYFLTCLRIFGVFSYVAVKRVVVLVFFTSLILTIFLMWGKMTDVQFGDVIMKTSYFKMGFIFANAFFLSKEWKSKWSKNLDKASKQSLCRFIWKKENIPSEQIHHDLFKSFWIWQTSRSCSKPHPFPQELWRWCQGSC